MRIKLFIFFIPLFLLASCGKTEPEFLNHNDPYFPKLSELKEIDADSCCKYLTSVWDSLDLESLKEKSIDDYYEYQILIAEIIYKADYKSINDSVIDEAVRYYDTTLCDEKCCDKVKSDKVKMQYMHARAHYYKGVNEKEDGMITKAFQEYIKALKIMEQILVTKKRTKEHVLFTGLTYNRIGWILYDKGAWSVAINSFENANHYFSLIDHHLGMALNYEIMGDLCYQLQDYKTMHEYYDKADKTSMLVDRENSFINYFLIQNKAVNLILEGKKQEAYKIMRESYEVQEENRSRFANLLGHFYYEDQEYDSALFYFEQSRPRMNLQIVNKYSKLIDICQRTGDTAKAIFYGQQLSDATQDMSENIVIRSNMIKQFNSYEDSKAQAENQSEDLTIIAFFAFVIITLIIIYSVYIETRKRRQRRRESELIRQSDSLQHEIIEKTAETKSKEKQIMALQKELDLATEEQEKPKMPYEDRIAMIQQNEVCQKLLDKVNSEYIKSGQTYPNLTLTDTQKARIFKTIDNAFPGFSMKIVKQYPRLTTSDVFYCCLYIMGLNEKQAAAITGKTYQAVWARSAKMNEIFGANTDLKIILKDFLHQWN